MEGGMAAAGLLATPGPAMDYLHPPVPTILIYPPLPAPPSLSFGSTHGGQSWGGGRRLYFSGGALGSRRLLE